MKRIQVTDETGEHLTILTDEVVPPKNSHIILRGKNPDGSLAIRYHRVLDQFYAYDSGGFTGRWKAADVYLTVTKALEKLPETAL